MGQYFLIVNLDKKEYIKPPLLKLWEICANGYMSILAFLCATNNPDGNGMMWLEKGTPEEIKKKYGDSVRIVCKSSIEKNRYWVMKNWKYFGRWCGDRIAVVGDYADSDLCTNYKGPYWEEIKKNFKNITEEAAREYNEFIEVKEFHFGGVKAISPDLVIGKTKDGKISIVENPKYLKGD